MSGILFIIVVIAIFFGLVALKAWQIRRLWRIAVHPQVDDLSRNCAPARFARFLHAVEPQLLQLGFTPFGSAHRFEFRESLVRVEMILANRGIGEHVSVFAWGHPRAFQLCMTWVTESTDGRDVVTRWVQPAANASAGGGATVPPDAGTPIAVDVGAWHRRRVEQALMERHAAVTSPAKWALPSPQSESEWVRSRADQMATQVASTLNWRVGLTGRYYEPSWPEVFRAALGGSRTDRQAASRGFEVVATPRPVVPLNLEPVTDAQAKEDQASG